MKRNNKGFTLAELLIVVAIIAVLVAVAVPVFSAQLEKSRESVDLSNIRAAYSCAKYALLTGEYRSNDAWVKETGSVEIYWAYYDPAAGGASQDSAGLEGTGQARQEGPGLAAFDLPEGAYYCGCPVNDHYDDGNEISMYIKPSDGSVFVSFNSEDWDNIVELFAAWEAS